jgi:hypothetical protein
VHSLQECSLNRGYAAGNAPELSVRYSAPDVSTSLTIIIEQEVERAY